MFNISEHSAFKPYNRSVYPKLENPSNQNNLSFVLKSDGLSNAKYFDFSRKDSYMNNEQALYENPFSPEALVCDSEEAQLESPLDSSCAAQSHEASVCSSSNENSQADS